jgi:hypothetical protein
MNVIVRRRTPSHQITTQVMNSRALAAIGVRVAENCMTA